MMKAQDKKIKLIGINSRWNLFCHSALDAVLRYSVAMEQRRIAESRKSWIPAFAGMTSLAFLIIQLLFPFAIASAANGVEDFPRYLNVTNLYSSLQEVSIWGLHWMFSLIAWMLFTQAIAFHLLRPYFLNLFSTFNFRIGSDIWLMNFVMTRDLMAALAFTLSLLMTAPKVVYMMLTGTTGFLYSSYNLWLFAGSQLLGLALLLKLFVETEEDVRGYYIFNGLVIVSYTIFTIGIYKASYIVVSFLRG